MFGIAAENSYTLTISELDFLVRKLELGWLPNIVGRINIYKTHEEQQQLFSTVKTSLQDKNYLLNDGSISSDLSSLLKAFVFTERNIELRYNSPGKQIKRLMLGRSRQVNIVFYRYGDKVALCDFWTDGTEKTIVKPILTFLQHNSLLSERGIVNDLSFQAVNLTLDKFVQIFENAAHPDDISSEFYKINGIADDAQQIGLAFNKIIGYAECVFSSHEKGVKRQASGAVSIYDTLLGRVIVSPNVSMDGSKWLTVLPGSDHYLATAFGRLINHLGIPGWG